MYTVEVWARQEGKGDRPMEWEEGSGVKRRRSLYELRRRLLQVGEA
jgi:hypothetical protein